MPALRAILSRFRLGAYGGSSLGSDDRRSFSDRRKVERRSKIFLLPDSESRLRFAAQAAGIGIYELDCASGTYRWSPELKRIAGLPLDGTSVSTEQVEAMLHPDDRNRIKAELSASLDPRGSGNFEAEFRLLRSDHTERWVRVQGRTFFAGLDQERLALSSTGIVMDITANRAAELALRRSRQDLELAVHGAAMGIWNWNLNTDHMTWSEKGYRLFGLPPGETMNYERFLEVLHPDDREKAATSIGRALADSRETGMEYRVIWPDGSVHWVMALGRVFHHESTGEALRMTGIAIDITERKHLEESLRQINEDLENRIKERTSELLQANEALERSNLELQQFAFIAAHDLQTPLRSISGFAQLLQKDYEGRLDPQADAWLSRLAHAAQRMHDLVRELLTYSRVESRGKTFMPVDFSTLFDDVAIALETPIMEADAQVTRDELPTLMGDRSQLAQVLQNLVDNGIKYRRSETPRVHVSARQEADEWVFSVRDNGIGIAEKHLEQIFDIFRRLHTQQEYPGTGIGLAICRRVIHRHGGRIWVESEPGKGSTFFFSLPHRSPTRP